MKLFINGKGEIKDVNSTSDTSLIEVDVVDDMEANPFVGWSIAKICCYKVRVVNGMITSMTPYVDSRLIEHIDRLSLPTELSLLKEAIVIDDKPTENDIELPYKVGYKWEQKCNFIDGVPHISWVSVKDDSYVPTNDGSDYLKAIEWSDGMEVTEGLWYNVGDDLIWQAKKSGVPTSAEDTEYFDIP